MTGSAMTGSRSQPRLLVTGALGPAGRSVLAQLAERGVDCVGADMAASADMEASADTVAVDGPGIVRVPAVGDRGFLASLRALVRDERITAIVPTVSEELLTMAVLARRGGLGVPIVVGGVAAVHTCDDKLKTARALAAHGVAVPASFDGAEAMTAVAAAALGTPFVSKPRVGRGGRDVTVHAEPLAVGTRMPGMVLQEFAPGEEWIVDAYRAPASGEPRGATHDVAVVLRKVERTHGVVGNASRVERVDEPWLATLALATMRALGLTGPADLDVRLRADGVPVVLEVNARHGAHGAHAPEVVDGMLAHSLGLRQPAMAR